MRRLGAGAVDVFYRRFRRGQRCDGAAPARGVGGRGESHGRAPASRPASLGGPPRPPPPAPRSPPPRQWTPVSPVPHPRRPLTRPSRASQTGVGVGPRATGALQRREATPLQLPHNWSHWHTARVGKSLVRGGVGDRNLDPPDRGYEGRLFNFFIVYCFDTRTTDVCSVRALRRLF